MHFARRVGVSFVLLACACGLTAGCGSDAGALSVDLRTDLVAGAEFAPVQTLLAPQAVGPGRRAPAAAPAPPPRKPPTPARLRNARATRSVQTALAASEDDARTGPACSPPM